MEDAPGLGPGAPLERAGSSPAIGTARLVVRQLTDGRLIFARPKGSTLQAHNIPSHFSVAWEFFYMVI